jgi:methylated-DNA-[protein]-cysteine S-methyltransferase
MLNNRTLSIHAFESPLGRLTVGVDAGSVAVVHFDSDTQSTPNVDSETRQLFAQSERQFAEYFSGLRTSFDLPLAPVGSEFQQRVWKALLDIPYGQTRTYTEQALAIGNLKAIRAVAHANAQNPLAIVIPCHRVIGSDGTMTGYAGGVQRKRMLLELEGAIVNDPDLFAI